MTKEEIIMELEKIRERGYVDYTVQSQHALDMAIKALKGADGKERIMIEYVKKADVLEIINSPLPRDLTFEYVYELKGVWLDEDEADTPQTDCGRGEPYSIESDGIKEEDDDTDC